MLCRKEDYRLQRYNKTRLRCKKIAIYKKLKSQVALKGKADYVTAVDLGISAYIKAGLKKSHLTLLS